MRIKTVEWIDSAFVGVGSFLAALSTAAPKEWLTDARVGIVAAGTFLMLALQARLKRKDSATREQIDAAIEVRLDELGEQFQLDSQTIEKLRQQLADLAGQVENSQGRIERLETVVFETINPQILTLQETVYSLEASIPAIVAQIISGLNEFRKHSPFAPIWPDEAFSSGVPKITDPFAGRLDELAQLSNAIKQAKPFVAVIGQTGQGKSCLTGEWYKKGARPPRGVGFFWRRVYQEGYDFDRFIDELLFYLTGQYPNRKEIPELGRRTEIVLHQLRSRPCWIIFDGAERWLKRWDNNCDATGIGATREDRQAIEPQFDAFLRSAAVWNNGSRILLTSRALPTILEEMPTLTLTIGRPHGTTSTLQDLKSAEVVELLRFFCPKTPKGILKEAGEAYGNHPFAVHLLGMLIQEYFDKDGKRWKEVNPLRETKLEGLLQAAIHRHSQDLTLLELVAVSLCPTPYSVLCRALDLQEGELRKRLAGLARWQLVELGRNFVDQHPIIRRFLCEILDTEQRNKFLIWLSHAWAKEPVVDHPQRVEEIQSRLRAVEHALEAGDVSLVTDIFNKKPTPQSHYTTNIWLVQYGYLQRDIELNSRVIYLYEGLVNDGHGELRNNLAYAYNSRGIAYGAQGELSKAIEDYNRAIAIREQLVEKEGRVDLRDDLAAAYNNRGFAYGAQGELSKAIGDYNRAIALLKHLIEKEGRAELRNYLAGTYNNRGLAYRKQCELSKAIGDYDRTIALYEQLGELEGQGELRTDLAMTYNNRGVAYGDQGDLSKAIGDYDRAITLYQQLVEKEGRGELRNHLAGTYNNRGTAYQTLGELLKAIKDYNLAIALYEQLVEKEGRGELRNDLASVYSNRGSAYQSQGNGNLSRTIGDFDRAIDLREQLVEKEGRGELRSDLAMSYSNRGIAYGAHGELSKAIRDIITAVENCVKLVELDGQIQILLNFVNAVGLLILFACPAGRGRDIIPHVNHALKMFIRYGPTLPCSKPIRDSIGRFFGPVAENFQHLSEAGLDKNIYEKAVAIFQSKPGP